MANNKKIELVETQIDLLKITAQQLIMKLKEEEDHVISVRETACENYEKDSDQVYQVQVIVTRHESEFIPFFNVELTSTGK